MSKEERAEPASTSRFQRHVVQLLAEDALDDRRDIHPEYALVPTVRPLMHGTYPGGAKGDIPDPSPEALRAMS